VYRISLCLQQWWPWVTLKVVWSTTNSH